MIQSRTFFWAAVCALGCSGGATGGSELDGPGGTADGPNAATEPGAGQVQEVVEEEATEVASEIEIATAVLSPTHQLSFIAYPEPELVGIREVLHADQDGFEAALIDDAVLGGPSSLAEVFTQLADLKDAKLSKLIRDVDASPARAAAYMKEAGTPLRIDTRQQPRGESTPRVAKSTQAVCAEPAWDWLKDDEWFRATLCFAGVSLSCESLSRFPLSTPGVKARTSRATYFAQSHCSGAVASGSDRFATSCGLFSCTRRTFGFAPITIAPRHYVIDVRSEGKGADGKFHEWKRDITSIEPGNFVGLEHRVF